MIKILSFAILSISRPAPLAVEEPVILPLLATAACEPVPKLDQRMVGMLLGGHELYGQYTEEDRLLWTNAEEYYEMAGTVLFETALDRFTDNVFTFFRESKGDKSVPIRILQQFIEARSNTEGWEESLEDAKRTLEACLILKQEATVALQKNAAGGTAVSFQMPVGISKISVEKADETAEPAGLWLPILLLFAGLTGSILVVSRWFRSVD